MSLGRAGIVLGLECSRLARNSADWHQLLELCGMTGTLICDEDGLYDPRNFNDRLLLGLKGALSEAELHFIRARLRGGQLSKARRGELVMPLPIGLVYDAAGHVILDPDTAIQGALRHLFTTFEATGSATACVKAFRAAGLSFPWRHQKGPRKGEVDWQPLRHHAVLRVLHNPRYAGVFTYGRTTQRVLPGGKSSSRQLPRDQWTSSSPAPTPDTSPWTSTKPTSPSWPQPPRTDATAPPGRPAKEPRCCRASSFADAADCRMTIRYHTRGDQDLPTYICHRDGIENGHSACTLIPGHTLDQRIGRCSSTPSPRWPSRPPSRSPPNSSSEPPKPTRCAPPTSNAPATTPTWPAAATSPSTPPTGSSPAPSKPTGTPPCAP